MPLSLRSCWRKYVIFPPFRHCSKVWWSKIIHWMEQNELIFQISSHINYKLGGWILEGLIDYAKFHYKCTPQYIDNLHPIMLLMNTLLNSTNFGIFTSFHPWGMGWKLVGVINFISHLVLIVMVFLFGVNFLP